MILTGIIYRVSTSKFQEIENQRIERNNRRVEAVFKDKFSQINSKLADWTIWDDTYLFLQNRNVDYIKSNLTQESFAASGIDEVLFIDQNGTLVTSFLLQKPDKDTGTNFPESTYKHFATGSALLKIPSDDDHGEGFIRTEDGLLLFVIRNVVKSNGTGITTGQVVFAKYFDTTLLSSVKSLTQFDASTAFWDDQNLPTDYKQVKDAYIKSGTTSFIKTLSDRTISGYYVIKDIFGEPQAIVRTDIKRDITLQGKGSVYLLGGIVIVAGIITAISNYLLLAEVVLKKVILIAKDVDSLGKGRVIDSRLQIGDVTDEIDKLRQKINIMLDSLQIEKQRTQSLIESGERQHSIEKTSQEKIRAAMLNLLEDGKMLERQLEEEKTNVEKKVEERTHELSDTKAKLSSSIENLPLGFLMTDINEKMIITNSLANKALTGKDETENLTRLKEILKGKIDLENYIKTCGTEKKSLIIPDVDLNSRIFQFLLSPVLTHETREECLGVVILIQDTTEAKILDRSKDEFFSIASHELRTPLTAIRGNTAMILEYFADTIKDPQLKSMIDDIHKSSIRLISIVNDFLNISRLEQQRMVYDLKQTDLDNVIKTTVGEYKVSGIPEHLSINYLPPQTPLPLVNADVDKVRQVLVNFLGNAIKFTHEGGVSISTEANDKFVRVLISDTGVGISPTQQNLLFHKFQQAGESLFTRDTAGGSGLGLYISKLMTEGMGGETKLERSEEGKGSTFSFTLPIATEENRVDRLAQIGLENPPSKLDNIQS